MTGTPICSASAPTGASASSCAGHPLVREAAMLRCVLTLDRVGARIAATMHWGVR